MLHQDFATTLQLDPMSSVGTFPTCSIESTPIALIERNNVLGEPQGAPRERAPARPRTPSPPPDNSFSDGSDESGEATFVPPLWLARRTFIFEKLKEQGITSVADLGCGSGAILSLLASPAYHRDDFPPPTAEYPSSSVPGPTSPSPNRTQSDGMSGHDQSQSMEEKYAILRSIPRSSATALVLHLRKLVGVDLDLKACEIAAQVIKPRQQRQKIHQNAWTPPEFRFEDLTSQVWCGNIEVYNEAIEDCEAIVLTEVIEHMEAEALLKLPSLLFNVYAPDLIVITTPNHSFNPYFAGSAIHPLYLDPTGRTCRRFRDPTHLFEFTPREFEAWCHETLELCDATDKYEVSFTGVGSLASYFGTGTASLTGQVPFPPPSLASHPALVNDPYSVEPVENPNKFFATQIAVFRKCTDSSESVAPASLPTSTPRRASRSNSSEPRSNFDRGRNISESPLQQHRLIASHFDPADPSINLAFDSTSTRSKIVLQEIERIFERYLLAGHKVINLSELWRIGGIAHSFPAITRRTLINETSDDKQEEVQEESENELDEPLCLRQLVGGQVGLLVNILLEHDDSRFNLAQTNDGHAREGIEALEITWKRPDELRQIADEEGARDEYEQVEYEYGSSEDENDREDYEREG